MRHRVSPSEWHESGASIAFDGLELFVKARGSGRPVLILHGFPTASYDFSKIVSLLEDTYRVILFDYPGFGFSDKPRSYDYSLFTYADAAEAVAAHFGVNQTLLLAHDIGDSVALELLRRNVLHVTRLVLLNGSVLSIPLDDPGMLLMQKVLLNPVGGSLVSKLRLLRKSSFAPTFNKLFYRPLSDDEMAAFWSLVTNNDGVGIYDKLMRYMHERWEHQHAWLDALQSYSAPLTVIWGQADPVATPEVADAILERRPDAADVRLENIGHYPQWEAPDKVARAIRRAFG